MLRQHLRRYMRHSATSPACCRWPRVAGCRPDDRKAGGRESSTDRSAAVMTMLASPDCSSRALAAGRRSSRRRHRHGVGARGSARRGRQDGWAAKPPRRQPRRRRTRIVRTRCAIPSTPGIRDARRLPDGASDGAEHGSHPDADAALILRADGRAGAERRYAVSMVCRRVGWHLVPSLLIERLL